MAHRGKSSFGPPSGGEKMKKNLVFIATLAVVLAGCAHQHRGRGMPGYVPDPLSPQVFVVDGRGVAVNQEPIYIAPDRKDVRIVWSLPRGSNYTFPSDGIFVVEGRGEFNCSLGEDKQQFACQFANSRPGKFKYNIKVLDGGKPLKPLDPSIVSDF
jgi:hypothetical protein